MNTGRNRALVGLGTVAGTALLLGAFLVVWLMPRGPETGNAEVQTQVKEQAKENKNMQNDLAKSANAPAAGGGFAQVGAPSGAPISEQPHVSVRGTGSVSAKPDIANMQVGVQIQNKSLDAAQSEAATKMDAAMKKLKEAGVDDKDVSTAQYNVEPVTTYHENQPPEVTGFRVTNILNVKLRDISKAGKVIDDLVSSGANTIYGLSFGFSDPAALVTQARDQAMKDAGAKADQLARAGGVGLGTPILIEEGLQNVPPVPLDAAPSAGIARGAAPPTQINPGQQEVKVEVNVVYSIK